MIGKEPKAKSSALHEIMEGKKGEKLEHKTVTSNQHKKIMREQGTEGYGKYK